MLGNWDSISNDSNGSGTYTTSSPDEQQERTHNFANEIEDITNLPFAYDAAGNMTEQGLPSASTKYYAHDAWNRLTQVRIGTTTYGEYEYNALHWRDVKRARVSPSATGPDEMRLMYYSANWQLLEERIDRSWTSGFTEDERAQTFWGKRYIDDAVARRRDRNVDGTYDDKFFYVTDAQFSTVAMVNATNSRVVERVTYDSYGKARHHFGGDVTGDGAATSLGDDAMLQATIAQPTGKSIGGANYTAEQDLNRAGTISTADRTTLAALTGSADQAALASGLVSFTTTGSGGSTVHGPDNPIAWDGYVFNAETGQYLVRFRWYDPVLGRWLERDPLEILADSNTYCYVGGAPARLTDTFGLAPPKSGEDEVLEEIGDLRDKLGELNSTIDCTLDVFEMIPGVDEEMLSELRKDLKKLEGLESGMEFIEDYGGLLNDLAKILQNPEDSELHNEILNKYGQKTLRKMLAEIGKRVPRFNLFLSGFEIGTALGSMVGYPMCELIGQIADSADCGSCSLAGGTLVGDARAGPNGARQVYETTRSGKTIHCMMVENPCPSAQNEGCGGRDFYVREKIERTWWQRLWGEPQRYQWKACKCDRVSQAGWELGVAGHKKH